MIDLYTAQTPNGQKVSIMLEEAGLSYQVRPIDLGALEQKQSWFLQMNPNGRIPVIVDKQADDLVIFESGAILLYLAQKSGKFLPTEIKKRFEVIQWLMFQMGGIGPMQGQAHVFVRYAPESIPFAIARYQNETRRLYEVYDQQLEHNVYLCGDLSIADFATFPWVRSHAWAKVCIDDLPSLKRWLDSMEQRPAVKAGLAVPDTKNKAKESVKSGRNMLIK